MSADPSAKQFLLTLLVRQRQSSVIGQQDPPFIQDAWLNPTTIGGDDGHTESRAIC
jgi:hypothetical protein